VAGIFVLVVVDRVAGLRVSIGIETFDDFGDRPIYVFGDRIEFVDRGGMFPRVQRFATDSDRFGHLSNRESFPSNYFSQAFASVAHSLFGYINHTTMSDIFNVSVKYI
jgi:hypothetical protein